MTDDHELQQDFSEHEDQEDRSLKDGDNISQLSLSSASEIDPEEQNLEDEIKNNDLSPDVHSQVDEVLHIHEDENDDELTRFIKRAQQQGFNCLDLSKKNISQFPEQLLKFPDLQVNIFSMNFNHLMIFLFFRQYLYLEGNEITKLPDDLFVRLPNLKWIDLRNNKITRLPSLGLDKTTTLRYLLLSGNLLRTLPVELGKMNFSIFQINRE